MTESLSRCVVVRQLGRVPYLPILHAMRTFTDGRGAEQNDELWLLEHEPVFTQGQAGKAEHLIGLNNEIPLVQSDRGGQVTYHGPGQLIAYPLINLKRAGLGVRDLVSSIERSVIDVLAHYGVEAESRAKAPGIYIGQSKIASLGLRIRRGFSFHGVAINFDMDLSPFAQINPCGYTGMQMTRVVDCLPLNQRPSFECFQQKYVMMLARSLGWDADSLRYEEKGPI